MSRTRLAEELDALAVRNWDPEYDGDALAVATFAIGRIQRLVADGKVDVGATFCRVPISHIVLRNPERERDTHEGRGMPGLERTLGEHPTYDSIPLVLAETSRGHVVWDGHHRLRSYEAAGRSDVPAYVIVARPGTGQIKIG